MTTGTPIACTLSPEALRDRTAWIADLNRTWLRSVEREPYAIVLTYAPGSEQKLHELVRLESTCCAFLDFRFGADSPDAIVLRIQAPAVVGAEQLLAPFLSGSTEARA